MATCNKAWHKLSCKQRIVGWMILHSLLMTDNCHCDHTQFFHQPFVALCQTLSSTPLSEWAEKFGHTCFVLELEWENDSHAQLLDWQLGTHPWSPPVWDKSTSEHRWRLTGAHAVCLGPLCLFAPFVRSWSCSDFATWWCGWTSALVTRNCNTHQRQSQPVMPSAFCGMIWGVS